MSYRSLVAVSICILQAAAVLREGYPVRDDDSSTAEPAS